MRISITSIFVVLVLCIGLFILYIQKQDNGKFVSSLNSKYCYTKGTENKNIKHSLYYKTLIDCNKPLHK